MMCTASKMFTYLVDYELFDSCDSRYVQIGSIKDLLDSGVGHTAASYFLEEWRREMFLRLHCLVNTEEGLKLADTIDMFVSMAQTRIDFSEDIDTRRRRRRKRK